MKKTKSIIESRMFIIFMVTMLSIGLFSCSKDDSEDTDNTTTIIDDGKQQTEVVSNKDPEGTIVVNMNNHHKTDVYIFDCPMQIDDANNFIANSGWIPSIDFISVGTVQGLSSITEIPQNGWSSEVAVVPGCGYVARSHWSKDGKNTVQSYYTYARIYVVDYILNTSQEIIGATIKYQSPWEVEKKNVNDNNDDQTATAEVKNATLTAHDQSGFAGSASNDGCVFYEDYDNKYTIFLNKAKLDVIHFKRNNGSWEHSSGSVGLRKLNNCSSIYDIEEKAYSGDGKTIDYSYYDSYYHYYADFAPNTGYACCFNSANGTRYVRIYTDSYSLDSYGTLESVTIQYQLY